MRFDVPEREGETLQLKISENLERMWYVAQDLPTALQRSQKKVEIPWILSEIRHRIGLHANILDLGCGVGLSSNPISAAGYRVTALDLSATALVIAESRDSSGRVQYQVGDAYRTPFSNEQYDVVLALDILNNVSDPQSVIEEAYRLLKPGGLIIYNSFNKNIISWSLICQGSKIFFRNRLPDFFMFPLFLQPEKIKHWLEESGFEPLSICGLRPQWLQKANLKLMHSGFVSSEFKFTLSKSLSLFYVGCAKKMREQ